MLPAPWHAVKVKAVGAATTVLGLGGGVGMGRWGSGSLVALVLAAACVGPAPDPGAARRDDLLTRGLAALRAGHSEDAAPLFAQVGRRYPPLADYGLYFRARCESRLHQSDRLDATAAQLLAEHPDSVWVGPIRLLAARDRARRGDPDARDWLVAARAALREGSDSWVQATLALARVEHEHGEFARALDLATTVRRTRPHGATARAARSLTDRLRTDAPALLDEPQARVVEAELRLTEGTPAAAREAASAALGATLEPRLRARALWVRAQAEHALRLDSEAEATVRTVPADDERYPQALAAVGRWHWNADDDATALALFGEVHERFPASAQAPEALYAIGRIQQEAGRYGDAFTAYTQLADRYPGSSLAADARWRAGWVRYLAGEHAAAAGQFRAIARRAGRAGRPAAEYWEARALEQSGSVDQAALRFAHVAERHRRSYYGALAAERLGRTPEPVDVTALAPPTVAFPLDLPGPHGERARLLAGFGLTRFARREIDALPSGATDPPRLFDAYTAIDAPGAAVRLARSTAAVGHRKPLRVLYPLAFWPQVRPRALAADLDPLLVESLIRQESLFEPAAVSPADAHGLMQLLPHTAREVAESAGRPVPDRSALHDPATSVELGTLLLHRLLERHGGSRAKALAAYNAGNDAVAKWERRYPGRPEDEFVELISFRETRDYVKAVIGNYQTYRWVYRDRPSTTSAGRPPNAPFDMITMTSPGAADSTR